MKRLTKLKDKFNGERIFIIGNGPSLNDINMKKLANEYTFSFNRAYIAYKEWGFKPSFYSCIDKVVLPDNKQEINSMILNETYSKTLFFFPDWGSDYLISSKQTFFLQSSYKIVFEDNLDELSILFNVGATSIQIAVYLGFKEIILLGCDCNYVEKPNDVIVNEQESKRVGNIAYSSINDTDPNHFCPTYFGKGKKYSIPDALGHLSGWQEVKKWVDLYNMQNTECIHIRNASRRSKLDFFEYIDFDESISSMNINCGEKCVKKKINQKRQEVIVFGASITAKVFLEEFGNQYLVKYFIDNDKKRWGNTFLRKKIFSPEIVKNDQEIEKIVIAVQHGKEKLSDQLYSLGVMEKCLFLSH